MTIPQTDSQRKPSRTEPTVKDLLDAAGLTPAHIEVQEGVSARTVYRAIEGKGLHRSTRMTIARGCGVSLEVFDEAHARSAREATR